MRLARLGQGQASFVKGPHAVRLAGNNLVGIAYLVSGHAVQQPSAAALSQRSVSEAASGRDVPRLDEGIGGWFPQTSACKVAAPSGF